MSRRLARSGMLVAAGLAASVAMFAGCRQILSIEEREFDPTLADAGSDAPEPLSCEAYCLLIAEVCTGANVQFSSDAACLGLCSTFPVGTLDDTGGNTLGCRIHLLETSKAMIESAECAAAGPGGNGTCGTNCESYCASMETVCPGSFDTPADCLAECEPLPDCAPYAVPEITPDNPSKECRLYHMSVAASNILGADPGTLTPSQQKHCPHATGETECIPDSGNPCPE